MKLSNLFRLHAILALPYALFLILLPRVMIDLMSEVVLNPIGANIARLMGAALILVAQFSWQASRSENTTMRKGIAAGLWTYVTLGLIITLGGQLRDIWGVWGWLNVASYGIFVIGYGYYLFIGEDEIARSA